MTTTTKPMMKKTDGRWTDAELKAKFDYLHARSRMEAEDLHAAGRCVACGELSADERCTACVDIERERCRVNTAHDHGRFGGRRVSKR